jgi:hypothetical protein
MTLISSGTLTLPAERSSGPITVAFANTTSYASYVVVFPTVKNVSGGSTQIAEVALDQIAAGTAPEIALEQPAGSVLANGSTVDLGAVTIGVPVTQTFTIRNTGNKVLTLAGNLILSGPNAGEFSITQQPALSINAGGSTTFTVSHTAAVGSQKAAVVTILNDDADEGTTTVNLKSSPVFQVTMDTSIAIAGQKIGNTFTVAASTTAASSGAAENKYRDVEGPEHARDLAMTLGRSITEKRR